MEIYFSMEREAEQRGVKTVYTIARAASAGMNITFARMGYCFGGRLKNNTTISGKIESMNVWYKYPSKSRSILILFKQINSVIQVPNSRVHYARANLSQQLQSVNVTYTLYEKHWICSLSVLDALAKIRIGEKA